MVTYFDDFANSNANILSFTIPDAVIPTLCSDYVTFPLQRNRATVCIIWTFCAHKASKSRFPVGVRTLHVRFSSPASSSIVTVSFL